MGKIAKKQSFALKGQHMVLEKSPSVLLNRSHVVSWIEKNPWPKVSLRICDGFLAKTFKKVTFIIFLFYHIKLIVELSKKER